MLLQSKAYKWKIAYLLVVLLTQKMKSTVSLIFLDWYVLHSVKCVFWSLFYTYIMQFLWNLLLFGICHLHWQKLNILGIFSSGLLRKYFLRWKITTFQHLIRCYEVDLTTLTASLNFFFFFFSEYPGVGNNRKIIVSLEHGRTGFIFWKTKYDFLLFFVRCM